MKKPPRLREHKNLRDKKLNIQEIARELFKDEQKRLKRDKKRKDS